MRSGLDLLAVPGLGLALALLPACSTTFRPKSCTTDAECGGGLVCVRDRNGASACVSATRSTLRARAGVSDDQDLGEDANEERCLAFDAHDEAGGIDRPLELFDQETPVGVRHGSPEDGAEQGGEARARRARGPENAE